MSEDEPPGLESPTLTRVLDAAARLQELVPDAVLVGGSAAALYAGHRDSYDHDHDHVVADLADRFDAVLEAVESQNGWVTNRVIPGKIILGELGGSSRESVSSSAGPHWSWRPSAFPPVTC